MANDLDESQHSSVLAKRQVEKDKLEQSTEAFQKALKKVFKQCLKDEDTRAKLHQEMQNGKRGLGSNPTMDQIGRATRSNGGGFGDFGDEETGLEKRYWENENDG